MPISTNATHAVSKSECHSQIIKALRAKRKLPASEKDIKLDMIYSLTSCIYGRDVFVCEDKSSKVPNAVVQENEVKNDNLRIQTLWYLQTLLDYLQHFEHLESLSGQFHGQKLTVSSSRMLSTGAIVHYKKIEVYVPA